MFRIRIGSNADPDPALYLNGEADPNPGIQGGKPMRIHADPDPGQEYLHEKVLCS